MVEKGSLLERLTSINSRVKDDKSKLNKINHFLKSKPFVDDSQELIGGLEKKSTILENGMRLKNKVEGIRLGIKKDDMILSNSETVKEVGVDLKLLEEKISVLEKMEDKSDNYKNNRLLLDLFKKMDDLAVPVLEQTSVDLIEFEKLSERFAKLLDLKNNLDKLNLDLSNQNKELENLNESLELINNELVIEEEKQFIQIGDSKIFGVGLNN